MPIKNWRLAMRRFIIEFGDRINDHLECGGDYTKLLTELYKYFRSRIKAVFSLFE